MAETRTLLTAEQFAATAGDRRVELVRGEVVDMAPVGFLHSRLVMCFGSWLQQHAAAHSLGAVGTELGFILSRDPDIVRAPDVYFISSGRLHGIDPRGYFEGSPDLAVEVLSPSDTASGIQQKVREYLAAGTRLVLVIDGDTRTVTAHHPSGDAHVYSGADAVTGEDVVPGFSFEVSQLFRE